MKQGFIIAKNKQAKEYFSSKGAYDRPVWTKNLTEASVYYSDDSVTNAVKKLWNNGSFSSKIIPLAELQLAFVQPSGEEPGNKDALPVAGAGPHDDEDTVDDELASDEDFTDDADADTADDASRADAEGSELPNDELGGDVSADAIDTDAVDAADDATIEVGDTPDVNDEAAIDADQEAIDVDQETTELPPEEDCEMTAPMPNAMGMQDEERAAVNTSRIFRAGQKVKWNGRDAEVIVPNAQADFVVVRADGQDHKVPYTQLTRVTESVESMGPGLERASRARSGERDWRAQSGDTGSMVKPGKRVWVYVGPKKYDFENNVPAAMGFINGLTPAEKAMAKMVQESATMPKRPGNDPAKPSENDATPPNLTEPKVAEIDFEDPVGTTDRPETDLDYSGAYQNGQKVQVPGEVVSALRGAIGDMRKCAEFNNTRDDAQASFCMTAGSAMEELLDLIQLGTVEGVKQAQIKMSSWMNPITTNIPEVVRQYVYRAGRKPSLKDLFGMKWEEKLLAKARTGFGSTKKD